MKEYLLNERIKQLRKEQCLTTDEIQKASEWSPSKISKMENGDKKISAEELYIWSRLLNKPMDYFVSEDDYQIDEEVPELKSVFDEIEKLRNSYCHVNILFEKENDPSYKIFMDVLPKTLTKILNKGKMKFKVTGSCLIGTYFRPRIDINFVNQEKYENTILQISYLFKCDLSGFYLCLIQNPNFKGNIGLNNLEAKKQEHLIKSYYRKLFDSKFQDFQCDEVIVSGQNVCLDGVILGKYYSMNEKDISYNYEIDLKLIIKLYIKAVEDIKKRLYCNYYISILQESQQQNGSTIISSSFATTSDITSQEHAEIGVERAITGEKNDAAKQARMIFERENYECESECKNPTFCEKESGKHYMELAYLIPISEQKDFSNSLDIDDNKICLCPLCNLKLHNAVDSEREEILVKLYYKHREQLKNAGIEISLIQLFKYYNFGDIK